MKFIYFYGNTGNSKILLGADFSQLERLCDMKKTAVVVDRNVLELYSDKLAPYRFIEIEPGEQNKTLKTVETIYQRFLEWELDRSSTVVGVGGGIVCDITGFASSTYLRGLSFGFVPTTLLAQVDASVGGKNGVNIQSYKNLVGTFNQPGFVLCDFTFLGTLPYDELKNGLAEVIKSALIADANFFDYIEKNRKQIASLKSRAIQKIVHSSLKIKTEIVSRDETETGERRKLN